MPDYKMATEERERVWNPVRHGRGRARIGRYSRSFRSKRSRRALGRTIGLKNPQSYSALPPAVIKTFKTCASWTNKANSQASVAWATGCMVNNFYQPFNVLHTGIGWRIDNATMHETTYGTSAAASIGWVGLADWLGSSGVYTKYLPLRCQFRLVVKDMSPAATVDEWQVMVVPLKHYNGTTDSYPTTAESLRCQPFCKSVGLGRQGGSNETIIRGSLNFSELAGVSATEYVNESNNSGTAGAAVPGNTFFLAVFMCPSTGSVGAVPTLGRFKFDLSISVAVRLSNRRANLSNAVV